MRNRGSWATVLEVQDTTGRSRVGEKKVSISSIVFQESNETVREVAVELVKRGGLEINVRGGSNNSQKTSSGSQGLCCTV
jgi:hypothetical protein